MKFMRSFFLCAVLLWLYGCKKSVTDTEDFIQYTIKAGAHYTDQNHFKPVETDELKFTVRFDSTAVYQTDTAQNQYDINKLYGFSDNGSEHHQYSARFGWRWSDSALRLFGYVYNAGKVLSKELGPVPIGAFIRCGINVTADSYLFFCNEWITTLPRQSTTAKGKGYRLYPYFGGSEAAPHDVHIWIKNE